MSVTRLVHWILKPAIYVKFDDTKVDSSERFCGELKECKPLLLEQRVFI